MKNRMDTRERGADVIVAELRELQGIKLAVLGSNNIPAKAAADAIIDHRKAIIDMIGGSPVRLVTSCRPVGAEKAARLAAKRFTGKLAVVFHRAEMSFGIRNADIMANMIIERESNALLVLSTGKKASELLSARFKQNGKKVYEIEIS